MRPLIFATLATAFFVLGSACAEAASELCPTAFAMAPIGVAAAPASLFGFQLNAGGARSVTPMIAFDTTGGWFVASIPSTTLQEKDRHYESPGASFVKRTWISPLMYIRFPAPVTISHSWVYSVQTTGDDAGWSKRGIVRCQPSATGVPVTPPIRVIQTVTLDPKDADHLAVPPGPGSAIIMATSSPPLKQTNCAIPFQDATVTKPFSPEYPALASKPAIDITSTIQVAINPDGSVADAWVFYPSGVTAFDESARQAAVESKYRSGVAYCEPVPGLYLFKVTFTPNSHMP